MFTVLWQSILRIQKCQESLTSTQNSTYSWYNADLNFFFVSNYFGSFEDLDVKILPLNLNSP